MLYGELEEARSWYEDHAVQLGTEFIDEVERAVRSIQESPERLPTYIKGIRRFLVHRFPFGVIYRYNKSKIQIIAVAHLRRRPFYWKSRKF
jgi:plasmid stabilization system protein ParE